MRGFILENVEMCLKGLTKVLDFPIPALNPASQQSNVIRL